MVLDVNWQEELTYRWTSPGVKPGSGAALTAGIDVGSVSSQAVVLADGEPYAVGNMRTGSNSRRSADLALASALEGTGFEIKDLKYIVGTGYGRVNIPMAHKTITEIACHARGANFIFGPDLHTILDVGGQDAKGIRCDDKGKVINFMMNDKCAAGTGRGMEAFAALLGLRIQEVGQRSLEIAKEPEPVSVTCVVFAKSEALALLRNGMPLNEVVAAYSLAMAKRLSDLVRRVGVEPGFAITGGQSKNIGLRRRVEKELGVSVMKGNGWDPQLAGAIGAAFFAHALSQKTVGAKA